MIHRTAVIKGDGVETGVVENIIMTDDAVPYLMLDGYYYVDSDTANIGDTWADGAFTPPVPPATARPGDAEQAPAPPTRKRKGR